MNKFFLNTILALIILTTSCGFKRNSFENYEETINETLNPQSSNLKEIQNIYDVKDMRGCGYMRELSVWYLEKFKDGAENWGMDRVWHEQSGITSYSGFSLDSNKQSSTPHLTKSPNIHIVYIGPWHYVKRIGKEIRFVAYQGKVGGEIENQFESKNSQNELIPAKKFYLNPNLKYAPDKTSLCIVKWISNHGYNAISKVKSKNPFSRNYMVPTGEIIEVEE